VVGQGGRLQNRVCLPVDTAVERVLVVLLLFHQEGPQRVGLLPQPGEGEREREFIIADWGKPYILIK
jgi:hypothetical protein